MILPRIYPITDSRISGLSHCEQVKLLIHAGASFIQLREKYLSPRDFYKDTLEAVAYAKSNGAVILINDRVDIAMATGAHGVHLGQTDLSPSDARSMLGSTAIIGYSTHSLEQAEAALKEPIDYIAAGPVFQTTTKDDPDAVIGTEILRKISCLAGEVPVVAIGGIEHSNISRVLSAGAVSAAVISALLKDPDRIPEQFRELTKAAADGVIQR